MRSHSGIEVRRCRPLLGTLVEISCQGSPDDINRAFDAIEKVHRLMSFHDPTSDVARMNREASHEPVKVHPWTWRVLKSAQEFSRKSDGVFDITVAWQLVKWDYLPRPNTWVCSDGSWRDIVLGDECIVRFRRPVIVDLGGIAKGFAVDRAVGTLKSNGVTALFMYAIPPSRRALPERCGCANVPWRLRELISSVENTVASMWGHCLTGVLVNPDGT